MFICYPCADDSEQVELGTAPGTQRSAGVSGVCHPLLQGMHFSASLQRAHGLGWLHAKPQVRLTPSHRLPKGGKPGV